MPSSWSLDAEGSSVKQTTVLTLDKGSINVVQSMVADPAFVNREYRKVRRQVWVSEWEHVGTQLHDHLKQLHSSQKYFIVQFDDEMHRWYAELQNSPGDGRTWFTPSFPIAPFNYDPGNPAPVFNIFLNDGINNSVSINPSSRNVSHFIDEELGVVRFVKAIRPGVRVFMRYGFRCPVRILELTLRNKSDVAQTAYEGRIVFEQVSGAQLDVWKPHPPDIIGTFTSEWTIPQSFRL